MMVRVALRDDVPRGERGCVGWSAPVVLNDGGPHGRCRPCTPTDDGVGMSVVTVWLRGGDTDPGGGVHYQWIPHEVRAGTLTTTRGSTSPESGHTTMAGTVTVAWPNPATFVGEAELTDPHGRRWDITSSEAVAGALRLALRRFERTLEHGDFPWA